MTLRTQESAVFHTGVGSLSHVIDHRVCQRRAHRDHVPVPAWFDHVSSGPVTSNERPPLGLRNEVSGLLDRWIIVVLGST